MTEAVQIALDTAPVDLPPPRRRGGLIVSGLVLLAISIAVPFLIGGDSEPREVEKKIDHSQFDGVRRAAMQLEQLAGDASIAERYELVGALNFEVKNALAQTGSSEREKAVVEAYRLVAEAYADAITVFEWDTKTDWEQEELIRVETDHMDRGRELADRCGLQLGSLGEAGGYLPGTTTGELWERAIARVRRARRVEESGSSDAGVNDIVVHLLTGSEAERARAAVDVAAMGEEVSDTLDQLVESLADADESAARSIGEALTRDADHVARLLPALMERAANQGQDSPAAQAVASALTRLDAASQSDEVEALTVGLQTTHPVVMSFVVRALFGPGASDEKRAAVLDAIDALDVDSVAVMVEQVAAEYADAAGERREAVFGPMVIHAVGAGIARQDDARVRETALTTLVAVLDMVPSVESAEGMAFSDLVESVAEAMEAEDNAVRQASVLALARYGEIASPYVHMLAGLLGTDPAVEVRREIPAALVAFGTASKAVLPKLQGAMSTDDDATVRENAATAYVQIRSFD
ncbi:MAG: HEAT repeat domain-containing protein [Planctomycetota bacterium]